MTSDQKKRKFLVILKAYISMRQQEALRQQDSSLYDERIYRLQYGLFETFRINYPAITSEVISFCTKEGTLNMTF